MISDVLHHLSITKILASQEHQEVLGSLEHLQAMGPPIRMEVCPRSNLTEPVGIIFIMSSRHPYISHKVMMA